MAVVNFEKKYLFKLLGFELEDQKLTDQVSKMGFDVEYISREDISIDITANRPDLLDIIGFTRALKNFMHKSKKLVYEIKSNEPTLEIKVGTQVANIRPFLSGMVVRNLKLDNTSLKYLIDFAEKFASTYGRERKKLAIGMHNLDAMEPPFYYDAYTDEKFIPLNSTKAMSFSEIIQKHENGLRYGGTIGGPKAKYYPALKDKKGIVSFIPIIDAERARVTSATTNILVDIDGTSRYIVEKASDMFAATFIDMGADVQRVRIKYQKNSSLVPWMEKREITIPLVQTEREIGVVIGFNNIISLANKVGYQAALVGQKIKFRIPEYRLDIINDQDVIEDIAIAYGYDFIQNLPVTSDQQGELEWSTKQHNRVSEIMTGLGFTEAMNSYMTNENTNFRMIQANEKVDHIKVKNAKTKSITMLRTSLLPSLLNNAASSLHDKMPQRLFELDLVFRIAGGVVQEEYNLGAVIVDPKANFNMIKATVETLLQSLKLNYTLNESLMKMFIGGRGATVIVNGIEIGVFGELHPEVLSNFGIEEPVVLFEMKI